VPLLGHQAKDEGILDGLGRIFILYVISELEGKAAQNTFAASCISSISARLIRPKLTSKLAIGDLTELKGLQVISLHDSNEIISSSVMMKAALSPQ